MSHTTTIKSVAIRDEKAIRQAVDELKKKGVKIELLKDAVPRMYYRANGVSGRDQVGKCDYVLRLTGNHGESHQYDVGLQKQEDGTFAPVFDEWDNNVAKQLGADVNACPIPSTAEGKAQHQIGRFVQTYAKHAAINAAKAKGYTVKKTRWDEKTNQVHLVIGGIPG